MRALQLPPEAWLRLRGDNTNITELLAQPRAGGVGDGAMMCGSFQVPVDGAYGEGWVLVMIVAMGFPPWDNGEQARHNFGMDILEWFRHRNAVEKGSSGWSAKAFWLVTSPSHLQQHLDVAPAHRAQDVECLWPCVFWHVMFFSPVCWHPGTPGPNSKDHLIHCEHGRLERVGSGVRRPLLHKG